MKSYRGISLGYRLIGGAIRLFISLFWRLERAGLEKFPKQGGVIVVCNHISHFDPFIMGTALPRPLFYLTTAEFFLNPAARALLLAVGCIRINRFGYDKKALVEAVRRLKDGCMVGVYPEGGLRSGERSVLNGAPLTEGVAMLASMSGAPVLPACIVGADKLYSPRLWLRREKVVALYGDLIFQGVDESRDAFTARAAAAIRDLGQQARQRFALTDHDWPQTAKHRKGRE